MSRSRYRIFEKAYPYFTTSTVVAWLPVFAHPPFVDIILDSRRFMQRERGIQIFGYVVMENHLHWIASAKDSPEDLSEQVGRFKSFTARHPQQIDNDEMMLPKLEYMHYNPVRRGYVDDPVHWRYSSARNYAGSAGLINVVTDWR